MSKARQTDQGAIFVASLAAGVMFIGFAWHLAARDLVPAQDRLNMWALTLEAWSYQIYFGAYLAGRWPPMIAAGYPQAFTGAVLAAVLLYGGIVAAQHQRWISPAEAAAGWLGGGTVGFCLMEWVPLPNALLAAFVMPGLAFFAGSLTPIFLGPTHDRSVVRCTGLGWHQANTAKAIKSAVKAGRTVFAGVVLELTAEAQHLVAIGVGFRECSWHNPISFKTSMFENKFKNFLQGSTR